ncbi:hypothetical protein BDB01DRAFT_774580 [Pilobolus umbonatus]|nr:hypothetical protein BDB01DRAFT_774580 [Pilobolus umbonatus]
MNITDLLIPQSMLLEEPLQKSSLVHEDQFPHIWERILEDAGYKEKSSPDRNILTNSILSPLSYSPQATGVPIHIKIIGRHMNGSFRCHIGTSKSSRPIRSTELCHQMRLLAVFFKAESSKSQLISPDFIFFPTWLLHLFRYTQHGNTPGRTDVRFLENANMAKEDHIYRLNNVLNTLFRFNLHQFDANKLKETIELTHYLFDTAGLDYQNLPRPIFIGESSRNQSTQPIMYSNLMLLLHAPRPVKFKPMCFNCNTKSASRRRLCVACYRYQLKHNEPRPLRLIVANRPGPRMKQHLPQASNSTVKSKAGNDYCQQQMMSRLDNNSSSGGNKNNLPVVFYSPKLVTTHRSHKQCANCGVQETHQWYRNLCGQGHWCETCKSYYLRHTKVRPPELFIKAAKRKVDVRSIVNWSSWSWDEIPIEAVNAAAESIMSSQYRVPNTSSTTSSTMSSPTIVASPTTPPLSYTKRSSFLFTSESYDTENQFW